MATAPGQSAILSGSGYSPWQAPLAALFSGISAAGQPGGWSNFGQGVQQGQQNFQRGQAEQQMMDLRRMQIEQTAEEQRRANQEREQEQATLDRIRQSLARFSGSPTPTEVQPVGSYGAATGGIQTASGAPGGQLAAMFGGDQQKAALFSEYADAYPREAYQMLVERGFAEPEKTKGMEIAGRLVDPYTGQEIADFSDEEIALRQASRPVTNITNSIGGDNAADAKLRMKLSEKEGERWSVIKETGAVAAGLGQDFEVIDQLLTVAPQGPLEGNLAAAFPGFSSAGDAFQSIVVRVAPSLRTPGSGATSDIEYEGMLKSLPRLGNTPEGNSVISGVMKAKAALNVERAQIVTAYENEEITAKEARSRLAEIDKRSIMTPELRKSLGVIGVGGDGPKVVKDLPPGFE